MGITKIIDNFGGRLVRDNIGDMNSGLAKYSTTFGADPFGNPGNLTWQESAVQIDSGASVITDLIMDGKSRVESGITYVYAIGHTGRLYKIQVNNPSGNNPNYDNPVLLTTLVSNTPTFTRGGSIDFYGSTERIYIGHDVGVTRVDFDGTNETFIGSAVTWTQLVPRPLRQFLGNLYAGNGSNIAEISQTTLNTYTKLTNAAPPSNTQVRDLDLSPDGLYLEAVVTRLALPDLTATTQDTTFISNSESYIFKWNGTDVGYTSFDYFPSYSLNSNIMFSGHQYTFGYDVAGAAVFDPLNKILSPILTQAPTPNAVISSPNIVGWGTSEFYNGFLRTSSFLYGSFDKEIGVGWWRQIGQPATGTETDVLRVPWANFVSNFGIGASTNGYTGGVFGTSKVYYSTLETSASTTKYKLYKFFTISAGFSTPCPGVYETQNETSFHLFRNILKQKLKVTEVRVYGTGSTNTGLSSGWIANNSFKIDLIGPDGNPISGASKTFATSDSSLTIGQDFAKYNPQMSPVHSIGVRITNIGTANWVSNKIELDVDEYGR